MTEAAVIADRACAACGTLLVGRWCHACGQDAEARPAPLREWASEAFSETNLVDGRTARTLAALVARPGRMLEAWRSGAGGLYQSPTKLFVVMTALFLLTLNFAGVSIYQYVAEPIDPSRPVTASANPDGYTVDLVNGRQGERWMQRRVEPAIDPVVTAAISRAAAVATTERDRQNLLYENTVNLEQGALADRLAAWLPNAMWLLMPVYALMLAPFFGRRRLIMEHLLFAMWAHVMGFALLILLALANKLGAGWPAWPLILPYLGYVTVAGARYYGVSRRGALWRGAAHLAAYVLLALAPAAVLVSLTTMDMDAYIAFISI